MLKKLKKSHLVLIAVSLLILIGSIATTAFLLFTNYQNIRLFKQAQDNFQRGDAESLSLAEVQLHRVIREDDDNEAAYIMLGEIAGIRKNYPAQVYYCYMAYRLNPYQDENKAQYIKSLCYARYFDRLENFLSRQNDLPEKWHQLLLYAAGHNGNINKHKKQFARRDKDNRIGELALLLFEHKPLKNNEKFNALARYAVSADPFLKQEILAAQADLYLADRNIEEAGKILEEVYALNEFAFAPVLGRYYANYRSFGKALEVYEKYLKVWNDPEVAMQMAEICCLLNRTDKIAELRNMFQSDSGSIAMLCCYYFDALTALAEKKMDALKDLCAPLRKNIKSPLAAFLFLCADLQGNDLSAIRTSYADLLAQRDYLNLKNQADELVSGYFKRALADAAGKEEQLLTLAAELYGRKPEAHTAKFILLNRKNRNDTNLALLNDALNRFGNDPGIVKIAIEYYLMQDPAECGRLIASFKKSFPAQAGDMLRYEIILAGRLGDFDRVSGLFRANLKPEILPEYWNFASSTMRVSDLQFLTGDKFYGPFAGALLLLKDGKKDAACDLLEKADAGDDQSLLFFAAKTLAENGRNQAALDRYQQFPQKSSYRLAVLLNMAELYAESGNVERALDFSRQAFLLSPELPDAQFCYADKLSRCGKASEIPDVVKLNSASPYRREMEKLWIAGMQSRLKNCDVDTQQEKIRELCRQLMVVDPDNATALEFLKKLKKMPQ